MKGRAAVFAIVAFVLGAFGGGFLIVRLTAASINETTAVQAAEAPEIARLYLASYGSLAKAAPSIVKRVARDGLHVLVFDYRTGMVFSEHGVRRMHHPPGSPPDDRARADRGGFPPGAPGGFPAGFGPDAQDGRFPSAPPPGSTHGPPPPGERTDGLSPADPTRLDWLRISIAAFSGEDSRFVNIPGGRILIFPAPEPILAVVRAVLIGLALVLTLSGTVLWLYVRGVRRAALRPLHETTLALRRLAQRDFSAHTIAAGDGTAYDELARAYNAAVEAVSSSFAERRAAQAEMQRFIADAGHEMRTPLTIVMGYLDIIDGGALADPLVAGRITAGMRTEAVRMRRLIDKLIILARMETPSDADTRTDLDVVSLVARVIESLEPLTTQRIDVSGVSFAHVFANEDDVADALINIVENAIKYAPASPIAIAIERRDDRVIIDVADRGPGMSTDEQRNAFERFYRGERRGEVSGSGLGLAIAKRAIERAGGTIAVASIPGSGSTFTITLPERPIAFDESRSARLARR